MSRGATGRGTRGGGKVARSESPVVRAIMSKKSPAVRLVGNLVKSKALVDDGVNLLEGDDVPPTKELLEMAERPIEESERIITSAQFEHCGVYDDKGRQILAKTSHNEGSVFLSNKEMKAMKGATFTHNHPLFNGVPLPFSRADVTLLHFTKAKEFRAVAGNIVFRLQPPPESKFWKMKEAKVDQMLNAARTVAFAKLGYTTEESMRRARPADLAQALDEMLKMVDRQIGLGYSKKLL